MLFIVLSKQIHQIRTKVIYLFFYLFLFLLFLLDNLRSDVDKVSINVFANYDVLKIMNETNVHQQYSGNDIPHTIYLVVKHLKQICMVKMIKKKYNLFIAIMTKQKFLLFTIT